MDLKESKGGIYEGFWREKGKGKWCYGIIVLKKEYLKKKKICWGLIK